MPTQRILVVEDSDDVASFLKRGLCEEGFEVEIASSAEIAFRKCAECWDLVILDLMLPDASGETVLEFLGQRWDHAPVLVLTARDNIADKVSLFEQGCDDYLTKPFAFEELLVRVRALLRRPPRSLPEACRYEHLSLEPSPCRLVKGDERIALTPKEFAICRVLLREPGLVISRKELLQRVWGLTREPRTNFIEVHLAHLRKKLSQIDRDSWLQTVRSSGFRFSRPEAHGS